ncbi:dihydrofolate reductase family protein [Paenibacillus oenotherae]|uniref:Dihydrofolate reductase family protein n=1 Tax=Paenibacillus oenotherae TaxID=1435645 RepID=A0ABS7D618_9BACL|nr:dihydrofolate reductase family protein [Paenibacillus oenotherae]MBW7475385.1 dihydrofolate reductase family protein [Paenibacillus oenotherae]
MSVNKVVLYIAMSLDGYIARSDGSVDWLFDVQGDGGDNGYSKFYSRVEAVVMGKLTYDVVLKLEEEFPYSDKPCYVFTRSEPAAAPHVIFVDEPVQSFIPRLKAEAKGDIWLVGGGQLVQAFLAHHLVDELQIAIIPKVLGGGIPLFLGGTAPSVWELQNMEKIGQIVLLTYRTNG